MNRKSEFLGMPFGTANYRLHRSIMFHLLEKLGENVCFRCGQKIESVKTLSIEHKRIWLDVDPDLFWDLENVTFSHTACNSGVTSKTIENPKGTSWCSDCKLFKPLDQFWVMRNPRDGRADNNRFHRCKACKNERQTTYRRRVGRRKETRA